MLAKVLEHFGADLHRVRETGWQTMKCPFHPDRTASARVNLEKGGFICMACGVKGSALTLIMSQEGLAYSDAIARAEEISGESLGNLRRATAHERPRRISEWRRSLFA